MNFDSRISSEEKEAIQAAKNGSLEDFEKILYLYERAIFSHIYRLVGQKQDAEDLTQETFIKLYKHIRSVDPQKNFRPWLYKIATNTVYDWWRKKGRKPELLIDEEKLLETIEGKASYYNMKDLGEADNLKKALDEIKPLYKKVLLLFYQNGFGYKEIAEMLSIPINTVKTYLFRGKKDLKERLKDEK